MATDARSCPSCGGRDSEPWLDVTDHYSGEIFHAVRCRGCSLIHLSPIPPVDAIYSYYANEAGQNMTTKPGGLFKILRDVAFAQELRPLLRKMGGMGHFIDLGCGDGMLAGFLKRRGHEVTAVDFYGKDQWKYPGIEYRSLDLNRIRSEDLPPADAVIMRHVLEHVHEPGEMLRQFAARGIRYVIVIVPNVESPFVRWFGEDWCSWDPPRHLQFFSGESLTGLACRAGYAPLFRTDHGIDELVVSLFRRQMLRRVRDDVRRSRPPESFWWYSALRPKGMVCTLSAALSAPLFDSVLSRVFELKERPSARGM